MSKILRVSGIILLFGILLTTILPTSGSRTEAASGDYGKIFTSAIQQTCADPRCRTILQIPGGTWVHTWCWRDGGVYNGTQRWFRIHYSGRDGWVNGSKMNPQPKVPYCNNLASGEALYANEAVKSPNGAYQLIMQKDGNLVEYRPGRAAIWASNTHIPGSWTIMQGDGNLVVYTSRGTSVFATGTGWSRAQLVVQSDSNVVIYTASTPLWASSWHFYTRQATRKWNAGAAGNCTWYAMRRWQSFWRRHLYPAFNGNASNWGNSARALKYRVFKFPTTQALVVFPASKAHKFGHVAWVDEMQPRYGGTWIHIWEMNFLHLNDIHNRWIKVTPKLSFIPASAI
jgi:surface antigen